MTLQQFFDIFQGFGTLANQPHIVVWVRLGLIVLGMVLVYLGKKGVLEPLIMVPMGFGMSAVNAGILFLPGNKMGTLFVDSLVSEHTDLMNILQIDCLQPIYTFMFSNGLIACFVFMGIGVLLDVGYVIARPFESIFIALCAELGTVAVFPIAIAMGLTPGHAASIAMVGGADGPMVLFTSLVLAKEIFVPITVIAYLYLGLTYGGYPFLVRLMIPRKLRGIKPKNPPMRKVSPGEKLAFSVVSCALLCLIFPVAAPLFISLFVGVAVREVGIKEYVDFIGGPLLYGSTFMLGLLLGILCEANTMLNPTIYPLLFLGVLALLLSGIGGIIGGYVLYFIKKGNYNPVIGIAGVSCVPTCAKVAQKEVAYVTKDAIVLPEALGACVSGVITSAIFAGIYIAVIKMQVGA